MALWFAKLSFQPFLPGDEAWYSTNTMVEADTEDNARQRLLDSPQAKVMKDCTITQLEQAPDNDMARGMYLLMSAHDDNDLDGDRGKEALRLMGIVEYDYE